MFNPLFPGHRLSCFFCDAYWGDCKCSDTLPLDDGFTFDGYWITAPNVSECLRFFVDPEVVYGEAYFKWPGRQAYIDKHKKA